MEFEFSRENFENYSNIKFHGNPSTGSRDFPYGQAERHDDGNFANAPQMGSPALNTEQLVETRKTLTVVENLYVCRTDCKKYAV